MASHITYHTKPRIYMPQRNLVKMGDRVCSVMDGRVGGVCVRTGKLEPPFPSFFSSPLSTLPYHLSPFPLSVFTRYYVQSVAQHNLPPPLKKISFLILDEE